MIKIGVTERGDAGLNFAWINKARDCNGVILITKHLSYNFIDEVARVNSIVHATITGLGGSIYEPNVPNLSVSKLYFDKLIEKIGHERVILRIDPIIPTEDGIAKAINVYEQIHVKGGKRTRVRISFMDNYPHVKERFKRLGLNPLPYDFHSPLELRKKIASYFPDAEICGEPGFQCIGCVSEKDLKVLNINAPPLRGYDRIRSFQRPECKCLTYKTEILTKRGRCDHQCIYCYWK
jgi:DNA repair photolyase